MMQYVELEKTDRDLLWRMVKDEKALKQTKMISREFRFNIMNNLSRRTNANV